MSKSSDKDSQSAVDGSDPHSRSNGQKRGRESSSDESSGKADSESERDCARPPNKRARKAEENVDLLMDHESQLSNYLQLYMPYNVQARTELPAVARVETPSCSSAEFLVNPRAGQLDLGDNETVIDVAKIIKDAPAERVQALCRLQRFNTNQWRDVKYSKSLQTMLARPGFTDLKVNDELCHLNKGKDYLMNTERVLAGLTNGLLDHKELVRNNLQEIVNWANNSTSELTPDNLYNKILDLFGPESQSHKKMDQILQVVCGKRAECIEVRRDRLIGEVSNRNLQATLKNVPPSADYLFDPKALMPVIQSLGGSGSWLNVPTYLKEGKPFKNKNRSVREPIASTSKHVDQGYRSSTFRPGRNKTFHKNLKRETRPKNNKNNSFRSKDKK
ncbi:uncharacterized protein [Maniola hyperantus]|uniref:uncharacterized protein n=1 Tax=Aphantopus hyperantus TaxID=2795564 RepID=UPI003749B3F1